MSQSHSATQRSRSRRTKRDLIEHLKSTGTGQDKLDAIESLANESGETDLSAAETLGLMQNHGPPFGEGTLEKARSFVEKNVSGNRTAA